MATFSRNALTTISSLVAIVIKGLMIWGSKCHQNNSPVVCDGYVKYEEAEVDRLVAILKTNRILTFQVTIIFGLGFMTFCSGHFEFCWLFLL